MARLISVVIPCRNAEATIGACLAAAFASRHAPFEVIVVDDGSEDRSAEIAATFPCTLVRFTRHSGASRARNAGAAAAHGDVLFFTDADCLLEEDTLAVASRTLGAAGPGTVVGGTYTRLPHDRRFFSVFQSIFVNHFETRRPERPDYVATHAMAIPAEAFRRSGGFAEEFLPILEDVELSHRLRGAGFRLVLNPDLQVRHVFDYSLLRSLRNALRKSLYWTVYSLGRRDLFADSGTASVGLKVNVASHGLSVLLLGAALASGRPVFLALLPALVAVNLLANRGFLRALAAAAGPRFAVAAAVYYTAVYPLAVGAGALLGAARYLSTPALPRAA